MKTPELTLTMPEWTSSELAKLPTHLSSIEDRMREVIRFSQLNVERDTGGPFAAGVFERDSGRVVAVGVNRVVANRCSAAHAEVMALSLSITERNPQPLRGRTASGGGGDACR